MQDGKRLRLPLFRLRCDALLLLVEPGEEMRERKAVRVFACGECACLKRFAVELEGLEKIAFHYQANDRGNKCYANKKAGQRPSFFGQQKPNCSECVNAADGEKKQQHLRHCIKKYANEVNHDEDVVS